jgi:hypothetical protein
MMLPEEQENKPELSFDPPYIEFGAGNRSFLKLTKPNLLLTIKNSGSGTLTGRIIPQVSWLSVSPAEFNCEAGESSEHHILTQKEARYYWDTRGRYLNNLFLVISNAGSNRINGSYTPDKTASIRAALSWLLIAVGILMIAAIVVIGFFSINWKTTAARPASQISIQQLYTQGAATEIARLALTPSATLPATATLAVTPTFSISPTPSSTLTHTPWPRAQYDNPESFIKDYYQTINSKQYDKAWKMLSPNFQQGCCVIAGNDGFEVYKTFWAPITRVDVSSAYLQHWDINPIEVYVQLKYTYKDGKIEEPLMVFYIIDDADQKTLLIDVAKSLK